MFSATIWQKKTSSYLTLRGRRREETALGRLVPYFCHSPGVHGTSPVLLLLPSFSIHTVYHNITVTHAIVIYAYSAYVACISTHVLNRHHWRSSVHGTCPFLLWHGFKTTLCTKFMYIQKKTNLRKSLACPRMVLKWYTARNGFDEPEPPEGVRSTERGGNLNGTWIGLVKETAEYVHVASRHAE